MFSMNAETNLAKAVLDEEQVAERAVSRGVKAASLGLKQSWRSQVTGSGLGRRLANTVRDRQFPEGRPSMGAASLVYTRAPTILDAHDRGALIRSSNGFYLAIPVAPEVQRMRAPGNKRITPDGWERKTGRELVFIFRPGRPSLLVDQGRRSFRTRNDPLRWNERRRARRRAPRKSIPIFVLLPFTKLRQKLDLDRATQEWGTRLPDLIAANWRSTRNA